jgi:dUTP pyrophosphatase
MAEITKEELDELTESLREVINADEGSNDMMNNFIMLMSLPEEQFAILAPGVLESYKQTLNNPNDKLALVQALNANGTRVEDLSQIFLDTIEEIDKLNLSVIKRDFIKEVMASIMNAINDTEGIAKRIIRVPIELCHPNAKIPQYAHESDSGMDVYAIEDITIKPGETELVRTGVKVALPPGYELQVRPKSGRSLKTKMRVANTPGTIDQGYRDEIKIIIDNIEPPIKEIDFDYNEDGTIKINSILHGADFFVSKGEKIAQLVLAEVPKAAFYRVDTVQDIGEDRGGGFGSTGLK